MKLTTDVISAIKKDKKEVVYGRKGTEVKLIATYGEIKIVEDKNGNRFSVKETEIKQN